MVVSVLAGLLLMAPGMFVEARESLCDSSVPSGNFVRVGNDAFAISYDSNFYDEAVVNDSIIILTSKIMLENGDPLEKIMVMDSMEPQILLDTREFLLHGEEWWGSTMDGGVISDAQMIHGRHIITPAGDSDFNQEEYIAFYHDQRGQEHVLRVHSIRYYVDLGIHWDGLLEVVRSMEVRNYVRAMTDMY